MNKSRIGIFFSPNKSLGGGYQYATSVLRALLATGNEIYIFNSSLDLPKDVKKRRNVHVINIGKKKTKIDNFINFRDNFSYFIANYFPWLVKLLYKFGFFNLLYLFLRLYNKKTIALLDSKELEMIFFPIPIYLSTMLKTRVVISILDLEHKFKGDFKEATAGGRWEYREFGYKKIAKKAWKIFVDSEKSKKDASKFYNAKQTVVLKYLPPSELRINLPESVKNKSRKKFDLDKKYVFYPAKFWPHKNQINLVKAIEILKQRGIFIDLVLTGSPNADFSTFDKVMDYVKTNDLQKEVKYFGYVSFDELSYLYMNSLCMAMPTFFGPTNIPVYEAWRMRVPVIYSDVAGCKEQLGDAGLLINPNSPGQIANAIERLYKSDKIRKDLISKGLKRLSEWGEKDFVSTIKSVISQHE